MPVGPARSTLAVSPSRCSGRNSGADQPPPSALRRSSPWDVHHWCRMVMSVPTAQSLAVFLGAAVAHVGEPTGGHSVGSSVFRGLRAHDTHALLHVGGGATVGEQDAVEARPDRS